MGTLGGLTANAFAVNDYGAVVGQADHSSGTRHAFLWQNGTMIDFGENLPPPWSSGSDINNAYQILIQNGEGTLWLWSHGVYQQVCTLQSCNSIRGIKITDRREILAIRNNALPFLWHDGNVSNINTLVGIHVLTLNNNGGFGGATGVDGKTHAAMAIDGSILDLGTLGGLEAWTRDMNDLGEAIGDSERAPGGDRYYWSFLWTNGTMIDLAALPHGVNGVRAGDADGINNCGEVVGTGYYADMPIANTAYLYRPGSRILDLREMIPADSGWFLLNPNDINDHGDIVGYGLFVHDFGSFGALTRAFIARPMCGDLDVDGDVDLKDYGLLQSYFTGMPAPPGGRCLRADFDRDRDIDLLDYSTYWSVLTGPK